MTAVSTTMSDLLYQAALGFHRPFMVEDIVPGANAERRLVAAAWLADLVARGELISRRRGVFTTYRWVN